MSRRSQWASAALLAAAVIALAWIGHVLLWTTFMVYDDEGYVLYSLREFAAHGRLYTEVYSQYGPFFFLLHRGFHALGVVFTNTTGRELALGWWIGTAVVCAGVVWRETRGNLIATLATLTGVFLHLWPMISEPSHPGGFIAFAVAVAAWCGSHSGWQGATRAAAVGIIGAALALTKINIGVFLFAAAGAWWLFQLPIARRHRALGWCTGLALAVLPVSLMSALLTVEWVRMYALVIAAGSLAATTAIAPIRGIETGGRHFFIATFAAAIVAAGTIALTLLTGTTPKDLIEGVILGPLRHPSHYTVPFTWRTGTWAMALCTAPLAAWSETRTLAGRRPWIALARVLVAAGYIACTSGITGTDAPAFVLSYGLLTAWIFSIPLRENDEAAPARAWLILLLLTQSLHAYPVAGSQISWGTFLWVPLAVLGLWDLRTEIASSRWRTAVQAATAVAVMLACTSYATVGLHRLRSGAEMRLPGAEHLRIPETITSAVQMLARNSTEHADVLFSVPGMYSFNLWTGIETPTRANATHWFNLLSAPQQAAIQQRLERAPESAVIVQRYVYDLLARQHVVTETPLLQWLLSNYTPAFSIESYEFWVRKGRAIAPVDSALMFEAPTAEPTKYKLEIVIDEPSLREIAGIELRRLTDDGSVPIISWTDRDARFVVEPLKRDGQRAGNAEVKTLPFAARGLVRIDVFTNRFPANFPLRRGIFYLRDATGRQVAFARFID